MSVMICPSSNLWIEDFDQITCLACVHTLDCFSNVVKECFYSFLGRLNKEFSLLFTQVESEKIKTFLNVRDLCFL
jgi:hypothetical protein